MKKIFDKFKRKDNWMNPVTNLGVSNSRTNNTIFRPSIGLQKQTLQGMYRSDGIAKRIVNSVVDDALREFINAESELLEELKRLNAKQAMFDAGSFGRLYGGALLVAFVDDGQELSKPLNHQRIHKMVSLQVFDRYQVRWADEDICKDFYQEHYGQPEIFTITKQQNSMATSDEMYFKVHRSRCFSFGGDRLCNNSRINNRGWEDSVLQACYEALRNYGIINNSSVEIVQDFIQPIMKMSALSEKLTHGLEEVRSRLDNIDRSRSGQNTILLDADGGEEYNKLPSSIAGLGDLWDRFSETICATTGIPASRLFGRSPAGLNSSGESDLKNWHDIVSAYREDQIEPCLTWLITILQNQQSWQRKPANFDWTFPALHNPSEKELAEIKKQYAEIDIMYADRGGISASEAWQERFGQREFQRDIKLTRAEDLSEEIDEGTKDLILDIKQKERLKKTTKELS